MLQWVVHCSACTCPLQLSGTHACMVHLDRTVAAPQSRGNRVLRRCWADPRVSHAAHAACAAPGAPAPQFLTRCHAELRMLPRYMLFLVSAAGVPSTAVYIGAPSSMQARMH